MELVVISRMVAAAIMLAALGAEAFARHLIRGEGRYFVWRPHCKRVTELNPAYSRLNHCEGESPEMTLGL